MAVHADTRESDSRVEEPAVSANSVTEANEVATATGLGTPPVASEPRARWASAISMAEAGLLTDVALVFDLAWIYIPILGAAFIPLIPTPFVILYLRRGARISFFAACVAGFLMTVLVGPHYGWRLTLEACIGIALGWTMQRRWPPLLAIAAAVLVNTTVVYVAAFGAVYALGLPLHDLYLELRNILISGGWLLDTTAALLGVQHPWLSVRPAFVALGHFTLAYWIPMFYLYVLAGALPADVLYYSVASTTAYALGHDDVRPFPPPWAWRLLRMVGVALTPVAWLLRLLWRIVTVPLWGPVWLARALASRRRKARLARELAALPAAPPVADGALSDSAADSEGEQALAPIAGTRREGRDA